MIPKLTDLNPFLGDVEKIAIHFNVSDRTVRRWLSHYEIYEPKKNFGPNKLGKKKAREIRAKYNNQKVSIKKLAEEYGVTFATISRILHNITYPDKDFSKVYVVHNPKVNE